MNSILFLILRRMRTPLLMLSFVYCIATFGLTLIPGVDDQGNTWYMDFFHAFYFVTFMGTTIGFGEIPYPFTDAQRMWALVFIYLTVATWIYAIGALINLLQNEALRHAFQVYQFTRQVRLLREPFYLVCGYGDTGTNLVRSLRRRATKASVIDLRQDRLDALLLDEFPTSVPGICGDASIPGTLMMAGIADPWCRGVVALTNDNAANLHIAITAKVMNPGLPVICRADSRDIEDNMASFGTNHIIDPFLSFAKDLAIATHSPFQYMLNQWFRSALDEPLCDEVRIPKGRWVICGFGRFGQSVYNSLRSQGIESVVIEPNRNIRNLPGGAIVGSGTGAATLTAAGIAESAVLLAGTNDDSNNLSIMVTARQINPDLFVVLRQNENVNRDLFQHSKADIVMQASEVISKRIRTLLTSPMTEQFLSLASAQKDEWAERLAQRLRSISTGRMPDVWSATIGHRDAHAVMTAITAGEEVTMQHLMRDHNNRDTSLPMVVLLHHNATGTFCMPGPDVELHIGDRLLFAGTPTSHFKMQWNLQNEAALAYIRTGKIPPQTLVGRWLARAT